MPGVYKIPPLGTLEAYPAAVRQWETVYEYARDSGYSERRSAMQAWAAVKRSGFRKDAHGIWRPPNNPGGTTMAKAKKRAKRKTPVEKARTRLRALEHIGEALAATAKARKELHGPKACEAALRRAEAALDSATKKLC